MSVTTLRTAVAFVNASAVTDALLVTWPDTTVPDIFTVGHEGRWAPTTRQDPPAGVMVSLPQN
jgi:hypothetical protein